MQGEQRTIARSGLGAVSEDSRDCRRLSMKHWNYSPICRKHSRVLIEAYRSFENGRPKSPRTAEFQERLLEAGKVLNMLEMEDQSSQLPSQRSE